MTALSIAIWLWIFTEDQTVKVNLDTHFSLPKIMFKSFIEYGRNIIIEEDMFNAFQYKGGMASTTVILLDLSTLNGTILKNKFKSATGS